ncbi:MAG: glycosyltransferase family 4 protein [Planctomycetaceae bacterium]|nr:glycosyltransferase family 4 protein [Planctomycetaceae bacterium]
MADSVSRVLILTRELSFRGSSILALRLAQGLESRAVETVVICTDCGTLDAELTANVRIFPIPGLALPVWNRVVRQSVLRNLSDQPPDVIHVQGPSMLPQGLWLGRSLQRPVILNINDQGEAVRVSIPANQSNCRAITCVSDSVRAALPRQLERIEQRVVLPGVPLDLKRRTPLVLDPNRTPVIGMAGPLEVMKGGSFFLRACHRVLEAGIPIRIVVTGSGPEERNLRKLATSLELGSVATFVDDGTAMSAYLSAIDIFCMPSLQQGFGIIMLEAMALGRPAIASGVGGILSIIEDDRNGLIVPPSDSRSLADAMLRLLRDPETARRIAVAGQNLVEDRFTLERMVNDMTSLYTDVASAGISAVSPLKNRP